MDIAIKMNRIEAKEDIEKFGKREESMTELMKASRAGDYDSVEKHAKNERKHYFMFI